MADSQLYLAPSTKYERPWPSGCDNLTAVFQLGPLAASVARSDPVTGAKKKLRKSYKGHIADLPGKNEIPTDHFLLGLIARQEENPPVVAPIDRGLLERVFTLDKTPDTGVPGFDASLLGVMPAPRASSVGAGMAYGDSGDDVRRRSKRKASENLTGAGTDGGMSTDGGGGRRLSAHVKKKKKHRRAD
ncbi:Rox3 mediator complex subunit-domain-containing protein [Dipodascopsis tothii]|uniref:Rox3 mediator complex subunit-domain-containing protein n=1 Tax=Dipodascopsis tothii TaxID=44089 RepID=UPI0034CDD861